MARRRTYDFHLFTERGTRQDSVLHAGPEGYRLAQVAPNPGALAPHALPLAGTVPGERGRKHIAMLAVDPTGATVAYRKMWLGDAEVEQLTPGDNRPCTRSTAGDSASPSARTPGVSQHATDTVALGIDAYVAGTVKTADEAALQDERARRIAVAHHVWVTVASFAGPTGGGYSRTAGHSGIWSPNGRAVTRAGPEPGAIALAKLT